MRSSALLHVLVVLLCSKFLKLFNCGCHADAQKGDSVFQMCNTSQRLGKGPDDVVIRQGQENYDELEKFWNNVILAQEEAILYLDSTWAIDSKRGWPIVQDIYGNLTEAAASTNTGDIPFYVYSYHEWWPFLPAFRTWWEYNANNRFITKYRAMVIALQRGGIRQFLINAVVGEGGGFCVSKLLWQACGRPLPPLLDQLGAREQQYYRDVCVGALHHPERAAQNDNDFWMGPSPCGWHSPEYSVPDACESLRAPLQQSNHYE